MPQNLENNSGIYKPNTLGFSIAGIILFCMAYSQAPLYYSNQNQYFLHGFTKTKLGYLEKDWLGNTTDPTPLFSGLVCLSITWLNENIFYIYYAILQGIFLSCAWMIFHRKAKAISFDLSLLILQHYGGYHIAYSDMITRGFCKQGLQDNTFWVQCFSLRTSVFSCCLACPFF